MDQSDCQLKKASEVTERLSRIENLMQRRVYLLRTSKRSATHHMNRLVRLLWDRRDSDHSPVKRDIPTERGAVVRVRKADEIRATLDDDNKRHGCMFIGEMYQYSDRTFRVFKRIDAFYDEAKKRMCRTRNIVALEGVHCSGRQRLYKRSCDRACFFFWHTDWLEPAE